VITPAEVAAALKWRCSNVEIKRVHGKAVKMLGCHMLYRAGNAP